MKRISTDQLFTLGLALYADRRTMEQRVRGIFGRSRTAWFARALSVALCLVVFAGCFTTACVPARETAAVAQAVPAQADVTPLQQQRKTADATAQPEQGAEPDMAQTETPIDTPPPAPQRPADPIGAFIGSLQPAAFQPVTAPSRVLRNPEVIGDGVTLTYDASVTIPQASAYAVTRMAAATFSERELQRLRTLFDVPETMGEGAYSGSENGFYYARYSADVTRKTWVHYELDWLQAEIALFDEPIPLTRAQTQPVAERMLAEMGAADYVLDDADEAIAIGYDAAGEPYAVSKGWEYVFVPQSDGLPRHAYGGWFGSGRDPAFYTSALREYIWLYVDEQGVSRVSWHKGARTEETVMPNVALLSLDEAVALANARFARMYRLDEQYDGGYDIRVQGIRLAAMLLANDREATEAYSVPVWEFEYSVKWQDAYRTICVLPFNAVDGGAVMAAEFPF